MAQITVEEFRNFFKLYEGTENQLRAIEELFVELEPKLRSDHAKWIRMYKNQ